MMWSWENRCYMHDIGNVINRVNRTNRTVMAFRILDKMGTSGGVAAIPPLSAIGDDTAPVNAIAAAVIFGQN